MKTVRENMSELKVAKLAVVAHCMCARLEETADKYRVIYPPGYFPDGVQASKAVGKIKALGLMLAAMDRHWTAAQL